MVEESDYGAVLSTDLTEPSAVFFVPVNRDLFTFLRKIKVAEPYFGRRVRGLVEQLGFIDVHQDGWTCMIRRGEKWPYMLQQLFKPSQNR